MRRIITPAPNQVAGRTCHDHLCQSAQISIILESGKGLKAETLLCKQKVLLLLTPKGREEGTKPHISEADTSLFSFFLLSKISLCPDSPSQLFLQFMAACPSFFVWCTRVVQSFFCKLQSGKECVLVGSSRAKMIHRILKGASRAPRGKDSLRHCC